MSLMCTCQEIIYASVIYNSIKVCVAKTFKIIIGLYKIDIYLFKKQVERDRLVIYSITVY